jgi:hypothetical protein
VQEGGRGEGNKERERGREQKRGRVVGKAAGDECVFIPGEGQGWQMRSGPTPYRTRRAVRAVTGPLTRIP